MKLEAGKTYLNRKGERVTVHAQVDPYPFTSWEGRSYTADGLYVADETSDNDLISEAPPEFKVGQKWRLRNGQVRTLRSVSEPYAATITTEEGGGRWWPDGKFSHNGESELDLIELVSEPEEKPSIGDLLKRQLDKPDPKPARKIVQLVVAENVLFARCDDGSAWSLDRGDPGLLIPTHWDQLPPIPQEVPRT